MVTLRLPPSPIGIAKPPTPLLRLTPVYRTTCTLDTHRQFCKPPTAANQLFLVTAPSEAPLVKEFPAASCPCSEACLGQHYWDRVPEVYLSAP